MRTPEVLRRSGLTARQLEDLVHRGCVGSPEHISGSGHPREWSAEEVEHVVLTAQLLRAGLTKSTAALAAAELLAFGIAFLGDFRLTPAGGEQEFDLAATPEQQLTDNRSYPTSTGRGTSDPCVPPTLSDSKTAGQTRRTATDRDA